MLIFTPKKRRLDSTLRNQTSLPKNRVSEYLSHDEQKLYTILEKTSFSGQNKDIQLARQLTTMIDYLKRNKKIIPPDFSKEILTKVFTPYYRITEKTIKHIFELISYMDFESEILLQKMQVMDERLKLYMKDINLGLCLKNFKNGTSLMKHDQILQICYLSI